MTKFVCPMHPEVTADKAIKCHICGMSLVPPEKVHDYEDGLEKVTWRNYLPLLVILCLIFLGSLVATYPNFESKAVIRAFMLGVFTVFSLFKIADLKGFAHGYATYDLLAKRWSSYGYIYPFIELFFGLSMLTSFFQTPILWAEILVMSFSGLGVLIKLSKKERFQCVCLGTFFKLKLTYVTLIEDFGMAVLAVSLLILR